jgi:hypothetical protein
MRKLINDFHSCAVVVIDHNRAEAGWRYEGTGKLSLGFKRPRNV